MPTKQAIKKELDFAKNMADILDIMKQLAQSQFTQSRKKAIQAAVGATPLYERFFELSLALDGSNPLISNNVAKKGIIVTTSDQSFMSALNMKLMKAAQQVAGKDPCEYIVTGRKGAIKFRFQRLPYVGFPALKEGPELREVAVQVADHVIKQVSEGKLGKVYVVSAESSSFSNQTIGPTQVLPFWDLVKSRQKFVDIKNKKEIFQESTTKKMAEYLAHLWVNAKLYQLFQGNKPAEFAALAMQMEGSFNNVKKVISKLNIMYKRARNEKLDAGLREVFVSTMVIGG